MRSEACDWERLRNILLARGLSVPGAITFHYLRDCLEFDIPSDFLAPLSQAARRRPFKMYTGLIQARPKDRTGPLGQVLRAIAKKQRKTSGFRQMPARMKYRQLSVRRAAVATDGGAGEFVASYRLDFSPECGQHGKLDVDILLDINRPRHDVESKWKSFRPARICAGSVIVPG